MSVAIACCAPFDPSNCHFDQQILIRQGRRSMRSRRVVFDVKPLRSFRPPDMNLGVDDAHEFVIVARDCDLQTDYAAAVALFDVRAQFL
jgi:hypothetical protein